jgi:hypothetical protein
MTKTSSTARTSRPAWLYFAAIMLAYVLVILSAPMPPLFVDYPDWVYQGVLFRGVITGHSVSGYALKHYPVPNSATTIGLGLLDTLFSWHVSAKLWVCFYLILAGLATWLLGRPLRAMDGRMIVVLPAIVFLNLNFWYGHISFEIGMCLVMILIALTMRGTRPSLLAAMLVILFFVHMEACACGLLFAGLWVAQTRQWKRLWLMLPAFLLTGWYAVARFSGGNVDGSSLVIANYRYGSKAFLIYKANTFCKTFGYVNARAGNGLSLSEAIFGKALFVLLAVLSIVIAAVSLIAIVRAALSRDQDHTRLLGTFVLVLLFLSLVSPQVALGTADPGSRLLLMASVVGFFLIDWRSRSAVVITVLSCVFCFANLWQFSRIQDDVNMQAHPADLPGALLTYGHVEPGTRIAYYQHLAEGTMDMDIFPTAMFRRQHLDPVRPQDSER